jgi:dTDP-4-amino-4,6-dideoxygalactose transaminase
VLVRAGNSVTPRAAEVADSALETLSRATGANAGLVISAMDAYEAIAVRGIDPSTVGLIVSLRETAEGVAASTLSLPIWPGMTDEMVARVADALASLRGFR